MWEIVPAEIWMMDLVKRDGATGETYVAGVALTEDNIEYVLDMIDIEYNGCRADRDELRAALLGLLE